jgi:hypothetical protein
VAAPSCRHLSLWSVASAVSIVVVATAILRLGPSRIMAPWDVFILLAGAWRIFVGQVPHTDFDNPIGMLPYWLTDLGMRLGEPSLIGYVYGNLLFLLIVASWGAFIFFRKLPAPLAFLLTLFFATLIVAPRPLGHNPDTTSYAMIYNRYGWALISILFIQSFLRDKQSFLEDRTEPKTAAFDAFSSGLLLGLILFCKINFFVCALAGTVLAVILRVELRGCVLLIAAGFAIVCFGAWWAVGVNPLDYALDVMAAGKSQSMSRRIWLSLRSLMDNSISLSLIVGVWFCLVAEPIVKRQLPWSFAIKPTLIVGFVVGAALLITVGNASEHSDLPLMGVAGVILLESWRRQHAASLGGLKLLTVSDYGLSSLIVVAVLFGSVFLSDVLSLARSVRGDLLSGPLASQPFDATRLRDFTIPYTSHWNTAYSRAGNVPVRINDGLGLLRRHASPRSRLVVLALTDPFSFALGLTPPRGVPLWWDLSFNFDRANYPAPERIFSEADFVMYPIVRQGDEGCCQETVRVLRELYGGYLARHYAEADRSAYWVLLEKDD